jgi:hypothetical protein
MLACLRDLDTFVTEDEGWRFGERRLYLEFGDTRTPRGSTRGGCLNFPAADHLDARRIE